MGVTTFWALILQNWRLLFTLGKEIGHWLFLTHWVSRENSYHFADILNFLEWKMLYFDSNFTKASIGSHMALHHTCNKPFIIWTNDCLVYWCMYASSRLNELSNSPMFGNTILNSVQMIWAIFYCDGNLILTIIVDWCDQVLGPRGLLLWRKIGKV